MAIIIFGRGQYIYIYIMGNWIIKYIILQQCMKWCILVRMECEANTAHFFSVLEINYYSRMDVKLIDYTVWICTVTFVNV